MKQKQIALFLALLLLLGICAGCGQSGSDDPKQEDAKKTEDTQGTEAPENTDSTDDPEQPETPVGPLLDTMMLPIMGDLFYCLNVGVSYWEPTAADEYALDFALSVYINTGGPDIPGVETEENRYLVTRQALQTAAYAMFQDFSGTLPDALSDPVDPSVQTASPFIHGSDGDPDKYIVKFGNTSCVVTQIGDPVRNPDGTVTASFALREVYEDGDIMAEYTVRFAPNDAPDTASEIHPYTILSVTRTDQPKAP